MSQIKLKYGNGSFEKNYFNEEKFSSDYKLDPVTSDLVIRTLRDLEIHSSVLLSAIEHDFDRVSLELIKLNENLNKLSIYKNKEAQNAIMIKQLFSFMGLFSIMGVTLTFQSPVWILFLTQGTDLSIGARLVLSFLPLVGSAYMASAPHITISLLYHHIQFNRSLRKIENELFQNESKNLRWGSPFFPGVVGRS